MIDQIKLVLFLNHSKEKEKSRYVLTIENKLKLLNMSANFFKRPVKEDYSLFAILLDTVVNFRSCHA